MTQTIRATEPTDLPGGETLRVTRRFAVPRERLFKAFTDPEAMVQWWGPEGMTVPEIRVDLRPGGEWRTCMRSPEGELHCVHGTYREIAPPERLVFTWIWEKDDWGDRETLVTIAFTEIDGETELCLTHEFLPSLESKEHHGLGWESCFNSLAQFIATKGAST